jgi:hypothetical protein
MTGEIILFPARQAQRLEVWAGWCQSNRRLTFFVSLFDESGCELIVWDGVDYVRAILAVSEWRQGDPGIRVVDRSAEVL